MQFKTFLKKNLRERAPFFVFSCFALLITCSFVPQNFINAIGLILLTAYLIKPSLKQANLKHYSLTKYMFFAILWLVLVTAMSQVAFVAFNTLIMLSAIPLLYIVGTEYTYFDKTWRFLKPFLLVLAGVMAVWGIYQVGHHLGKGHAEGPFNDRNTFASMMNALWFLTVWQFFSLSNHFESTKPKFKSTLLQTSVFVLLFFVSLCLFMTSSRGAMIAWSILSPIMFWASYRHTKSKYLLVSALIIVVIAFFASGHLFHSNVAGRTIELAQDQSTIARIQLWLSTFYMTVDYPLFGVGWNNFQYFYPQYRYIDENTTAGFYTHNDYLQLGAEGGVIALGLISALLVWVLLRVKKLIVGLHTSANGLVNIKTLNPQPLLSKHVYEALALMLGAAAIMIHAGVNFIFYYISVNLILGLYLARASILIETHQMIILPKFDSVRPSVKALVWKFLGFIVLAPFVVHALLQLTFSGNQPLRKLLNQSGLTVSSFDLASATVNLYPYNHYAEDFMMRSYERLLLDTTEGVDEKITKQLLNLAISDFDKFRLRNANSANIGASEARLIIQHLNLDNQQHALKEKASQILASNLKSNPFHGETYALRARLESYQGLHEQANATIDESVKHIHLAADLVLVNLQYMRQNKKLTHTDLMEVDELEMETIRLRNLSLTGIHISADKRKSQALKVKALFEKLMQRPDFRE